MACARILLLTAVVLSEGGCVFFGAATNADAASKAAAATYDGPACGRVLHPMDNIKTSDYNRPRRLTLEDNPEIAAQVLLAVCLRRVKHNHTGHTIPQWPRIRPIRATDTYRELDDYQLDVVRAATSAILNARPDTYGYSPQPPKNVLGLYAMWGEIIDLDTLRAALKKIDLPQPARTALVQNFRQLATRARAFEFTDVERELLVDIPVAVYHERQKHYQKHAAHYKTLKQLTEDVTADNSDEHVAALRALRRDMLAACDTPRCQDMPLIASVTKALALLHVVRNERVDARAESSLFHRNGSYRSGFAQAVRVAQNARIERLREIYDTFRRARRNGSSEAVADEIAGGRGAKVRYNLPLTVRMKLPDYARAIEKNSYYRSARKREVTAVGLMGKRAQVRLKGQKKPLTFPRSDVTGLRANDQLFFVTVEDESRTVKATREGVLIHLRDSPVPLQAPTE